MIDVAACQALLGRLTIASANDVKTTGASASVSSRELKAALGDEHWDLYQNERVHRKVQLEEAAECKHELRDYIKLLRIADFNFEGIDRASQKGWKRKATAMTSDAGYERAIERLHELLTLKPSLVRFFDRSYDFETSQGNNGICKNSVPRPIYHKRGVYEVFEHKEIETVQDLRISALRNAINQNTAEKQADDNQGVERSLEENWRRFEILRKLIRR